MNITTEEQRENNRNRKVTSKNNRTNLISFLIKYSLNKYIIILENSIKTSHHSNCIFIDKLIRRIDGLEEISFDDCLAFVQSDSRKYKEEKQILEILRSSQSTNEEQSIPKERLDYREPALVMMINILLFSLEFYDEWIFHWNKPKKEAHHLVYTSQLFKSVIINGKVFTYKQVIEEGEEFYQHQLVPILNGDQPDDLWYNNYIVLGKKKSRKSQ